MAPDDLKAFECDTFLIFTWSVERSMKSSGGFVITYLLLEASNELEVSRNLNKVNIVNSIFRDFDNLNLTMLF